MKYRAPFLILFFITTSVFCNNWLRLNATQLAESKQRIVNGTASKHTLNAYHNLLHEAEALLICKNPTVMDKTILPPTKNKHDYLSISRYWWPDSSKKDGLPWYRKDGITNPDTQTDAVDRKRLSFMANSVRKLGLAYYFTGDEKYAKKGISMLKTWFLNPETSMNPHLEFGQSIPGYSETRPFGILDGRSIVRFVPDTVNLLENSKHWNTNYGNKMNKWFSDYLQWLTTSKLGVKGSLLDNNHGSWYKYQVAALAYYLNQKKLVVKMVNLAEQSLDQMLNEQGGQIHELARSRSYFYSCFNLQALTGIADLGDKVGMDMWNFKTENNKSLLLAIDYLIPATNGETWKHSTLKKLNFSGLIPVVSRLYKKKGTLVYKKLLKRVLKVSEKEKKKNRFQEFWLFNTI